MNAIACSDCGQPATRETRGGPLCAVCLEGLRQQLGSFGEHLSFPADPTWMDPWELFQRDQAYLNEVYHEVTIGLKLIQALRARAGSWIEDYDFPGLAEDPNKKTRVAAFFEVRAEISSLVEGILTAWARVSLLLFPSNRGKREIVKRAQHRGAWLRKRLGVADGHPVANRALRNHWVHFDERMDSAFTEGGYQVLPRWSIGRTLTDAEKRYALRTIEVDTLTVRMMGEAILIASLEEALTDLKDSSRVAMGVASPEAGIQA